MSIIVTSPSFKEGEMIPKQFTCDGRDVSPRLSWSGVPAGTKSIALICDDPDAPAGTWVHWVVYDIPADAGGLPEGAGTTGGLPAGAKQGTNDFHKIGYGGPCPPRGTHRYFFKVYALDALLPLREGASKAEVEKAMQGLILAQGRLMGNYRRG